MKRGIVITAGLLLAVILLTAGITGCNNSNPVGNTPPPPAATAAVPDVNVSFSTQTEGIWISGTGKVTVTPDIALLMLGVEAQEVSVTEAQASSSKAMENLMTALRDNGLAEKDIQTQNFRIRQRTRWDEATQEEIVIGYRVTNEVIAKIRDLEKIGDIIEAVVTAGGDYTRINDLNFSVEDPTKYYDEAREKALADARDKAQKIADLSDMALGDPTYISESSSSSFYNYSAYGMAAPAPAPAPTIMISEAPPISPGEVEITVNMQVAYEMEDKAPVVVQSGPIETEP